MVWHASVVHKSIGMNAWVGIIKKSAKYTLGHIVIFHVMTITDQQMNTRWHRRYKINIPSDFLHMRIVLHCQCKLFSLKCLSRPYLFHVGIQGSPLKITAKLYYAKYMEWAKWKMGKVDGCGYHGQQRDAICDAHGPCKTI